VNSKLFLDHVQRVFGVVATTEGTEDRIVTLLRLLVCLFSICDNKSPKERAANNRTQRRQQQQQQPMQQK
jgi:hypothetical protein